MQTITSRIIQIVIGFCPRNSKETVIYSRLGFSRMEKSKAKKQWRNKEKKEDTVLESHQDLTHLFRS